MSRLQASAMMEGRRTAAIGVLLVFAAALADIAAGEDVVLIPLLVVGPLVAAVRAPVRQVAAVSLLALVVAVPLGAVNDISGEAEHVGDLVAIALVGLLALFVARGRDTLTEAAQRSGAALSAERTARRRAELLSRLTALLDAPLHPETRLEHLAALLVPDVCDLVVIDVAGEGGRAVVQATDPAVAERVRALRDRAALDREGDHPAMEVLRTGRPLLLTGLPDDRLRSWAADEEHLMLMRELAYRSAVIVPLTSAGRVTAVLTALRLGETRPPYGQEDLETLMAYAERAAAAVDAAHLHAELRATERRLEAILTSVGEAVVALGPDGRLAFANQSAADLLGLGTPAELVGRLPQAVVPPFVTTDEHGNPLAMADLPRLRALRDAPSDAIVVRAAYEDGSERWLVLRSKPVLDDAGRTQLVVVVAEDVTAVKRAELRQRLLAIASGLVGSSLDVDATLDKAAWAVVPELADWARLDMPDERGVLREVAVAHRDLGKLELLREWRRHYPPLPEHPRGPWAVMRSGEPAVWLTVDEADIDEYARDGGHARLMRAIATRSMLIVPLIVGDRVIGTLQLATTSDSERRLGLEDLELAQELARRAAIAVENARVHEARSHIASTLQRSLLPPRLPEVPGLRTAARFRAASGTSEVGGDFYDVFAAGEHWFVVMGDVAGKGPDAAAVTSLARWTMRTSALYEDRPEHVLRRLNEVLIAAGGRRDLCTALCARITPRAGGVDLLLASGGHPLPYLIDRTGEVREVGGTGTVLGAFPQIRLTAEDVRLEPGDSVVLFTDGVPDTRGTNGRFGHGRLEELLRAIGPAAPDVVATRVDEALHGFQDGPQGDDVALLVLTAVDD